MLEVGAAYQDFAFSYACFEEHAQSPIGEPVVNEVDNGTQFLMPPCYTSLI